MPVLNRAMGLDLVRTNMHKVFIIAVYTTVALAVLSPGWKSCGWWGLRWRWAIPSEATSARILP